MWSLIFAALLQWQTAQTIETPRGDDIGIVAHASGVMLPLLLPQIAEVRPPSSQQISTTIQDPNFPEEPWVVTTHRILGESNPAWVIRHSAAVEAVRDWLN